MPVAKTKILKIGRWEIQHYTEPEYISYERIIRAEKFLNGKWIKAEREFPSENPETLWAGLKKFRIPSPFIRVEVGDLDLYDDVEKCIYSIGKRPTLGLLALLTHYRPEHRKIIQKAAYKIAGLIQIDDFVQDDRYLAEILGVPYYTKIPYDEQPENYHRLLDAEELKEYQKACLKDQYYWVRTDPCKEYPQELLERLEAISLVPVRADGCNSEFMALGMAKRASSMLEYDFLRQPEREKLKGLLERVLPWNESFVVKPVQGTWGRNVEIYHLDDPEEERNAVKERIINLIHTFGPHQFMLQPYILPRVIERDGGKHPQLQKLYFVNLDGKGKYVFTGGLAQESPQRKICGIEGIFTPLLPR